MAADDNDVDPTLDPKVPIPEKPEKEKSSDIPIPELPDPTQKKPPSNEGGTIDDPPPN